MPSPPRVCRLIVVLGDQLDPSSAAFDGFDVERDLVMMVEAAAEAQHVPSHKARLALFLSAMRHFRDELAARGFSSSGATRTRCGRDTRGVYWHLMSDYLARNVLGTTRSLPGFHWTGETAMRCLSEFIGTTLRHGYSHRIQRRMVTGLFALLLGDDPRGVHASYLAMYVDAVEWVELPNTLGMSQHADGGIMASTPYVASGRHIDRMSGFCRGCRHAPGAAAGDDACPFTTRYWDFLARHWELPVGNPRMAQQLRKLVGIPEDRLRSIRARARRLARAPP